VSPQNNMNHVTVKPTWTASNEWVAALSGSSVFLEKRHEDCPMGPFGRSVAPAPCGTRFKAVTMHNVYEINNPKELATYRVLWNFLFPQTPMTALRSQAVGWSRWVKSQFARLETAPEDTVSA